MRLSSLTRKPSLRSGVAALELAVLAPFLTFMVVIAVDWARIFFFTITVNDCARNGAAYLSDPTIMASSPYTSYTDAALAGTNLSPTPTVSSATGTDANGSWSEVTVAYPFTTVVNFPGVPASTTVQKTVRMYTAARTPI